MRVTTVRFGVDLWRLLEAEAALSGVSTSQYIREAALARAAAAAAARGEDPLALLAGAEATPARRTRRQQQSERAAALLQRAAETRKDNKATSAEADQAVRRAREVLKTAAQLVQGQQASRS
jgi:hypothetical protein